MSNNFGFHYPHFTVRLCRMCAELWGWTTVETLAQPLELVLDMFRDINLKDAVERAHEDHGCETPEDVLRVIERAQPIDPLDHLQSETKTITF